MRACLHQEVETSFTKQRPRSLIPALRSWRHQAPWDSMISRSNQSAPGSLWDPVEGRNWGRHLVWCFTLTHTYIYTQTHMGHDVASRNEKYNCRHIFFTAYFNKGSSSPPSPPPSWESGKKGYYDAEEANIFRNRVFLSGGGQGVIPIFIVSVQNTLQTPHTNQQR